jgi:hypothetical protein
MSAVRHELDQRLALIAAAVEDARGYQHEHGLSDHRSRKLPADVLRALRRWQGATSAAVGTTVTYNTAATAPHDGQPTAGKAVKSPPAKGAQGASNSANLDPNTGAATPRG